MAWNGSDREKAKARGEGEQRGKKNPTVRLSSSPSPKFNYKALAAGLVVVIGGVAAWFMLGRSGAGPEDGGRGATRSTTIAEVKPRIATNVVEEAPKRKNYSEMSREEKLAMYEKRYGTNIPENLKSTYYFLKNPPQRTYKPLPRREEIFEHDSERTIASVLLIEPGAFVMRRSTYDESFDDDFKKSLETPTLITKDDTPEQRELKEAVNEVKAELAERMRKGEKPSDIMTAAMDTAYELGKYRQNVEEMIHDMEDDPSASDQNVEDFVTAANKMLKENGANEIDMPSLVKRQVRLRNRARRAELMQQQEAKNKEDE